MPDFTYEQHLEPGDPREQWVIVEREGKAVVGKYRVVGPESYVQGEVRRLREKAKRAPIRYRPAGVI